MVGKTKKSGFSLIEVIAGTAIFVLFASGIYSAIVAAERISYRSRISSLENAIMTEQMESIRNLPYQSVGVVNGTPAGSIVSSTVITRSGSRFLMTTAVASVTVNGIPDVFRAVDLVVQCQNCRQAAAARMSTNIRQNAKNALNVKVIDSDGDPVFGAAVTVVDSITSSTINGVTGSDGTLDTKLTNVATGTFRYNITVTKSGYSTDYTTAPSMANPSPTKLPATVVDGATTDLVFSIDQASTLTLKTLNSSCTPVANANFKLTGSKLIGFPNNYKYSQALATDGSGNLTVSNLEWGNYSVSFPDNVYDLAGSNPLIPLSVGPGTNQDLNLNLVAHDPHTLLVTVKDATTGLPVGGVDVQLGGYSGTTDGGNVGQTDWSTGSGQALFTSTTKYFADDLHVATNVAQGGQPGELILKINGGPFFPSGYVESSTFDLGSSNYLRSVVIIPDLQPASTNIQVQVAASSSSAGPWTYRGPDGTTGTYFTSTISNFLSAPVYRYVRYKVVLSGDTSDTPDVSGIYIIYSNGCSAPGQYFFSSVPSSTYTLQVSKSGYNTVTTSLGVSGQAQITMNISPMW